MEVKKSTNFMGPKEEGKTSIQRLILTIVLILVVVLGLYYTYQYYTNKAPGDDTKDTTKLESGWNGIYKKEEANNEVLIYTSDDKIASLILAKKLIIPDAEPVIMYPMQYDGALTIKDGKMLFVQEEVTVFTIERTDDKIVITYDGDPATKDSYNELVGTYNRTKNVTEFNTDEFE